MENEGADPNTCDANMRGGEPPAAHGPRDLGKAPIRAIYSQRNKGEVRNRIIPFCDVSSVGVVVLGASLIKNVNEVMGFLPRTNL